MSDTAHVRVCAVDWSGKETGAEESIWLAEACDGELVNLRSGFGRQHVVERLVDMARDELSFAVGFDFAFSFPRWWCEQRGWTSARDVWSAMAIEGDQLLEACAFPFWGRPGEPNAHGPDQAYRRTEREVGGGAAKSVFQIGGAGAVGTGSIRGMPHLRTLADEHFSVWPFDPPSSRTVVEIYPRALTGRVRKSRWSARHEYLSVNYPQQPDLLLERAAGSEDAFDAAISAIVMSAHQDELAMLDQIDDADYAIEGRIWHPAASSPPAAAATQRRRVGSPHVGSIDFDRARAFVTAVPRGRWTSYKDVAIAAGGPQGAQAVGQWLRRSGGEIANVYRVLTVDGYVAEGFVPGGPSVPDSEIEVRRTLREEGVRIDDRGRAHPSQRLRADEWSG